MRKHSMILTLVVLICCCSAAYCQGVPATPATAELPHWPASQTGRVIAVVPPSGSVPETTQWPAVARLELNDVPFVLYAKHLAGYDPETGTGKFAVWLSVPGEHLRGESNQPLPRPEAHAYLRTAGYGTLTAELYVGPGERWGDAPPGSAAWTPGTDRLLITQVEPLHGTQQLPSYGLVRIMGDGREITRVRITCRCPQYNRGMERELDEEWIAWQLGNEQIKVDQWGLPGNTAAPGMTPVADGAEGGMNPADVARFAGSWLDETHSMLLSIFADGTWAQFNFAGPETTPRAGTWGVFDDRLRLRTSLSSPSQLWASELSARSAELLTRGDYDLTVVYDLERQQEALVGNLRRWTARTHANGGIESFTAWNSPDCTPSRVRWLQVRTVFPPLQDAQGNIVIPTELQRMLEKIPPTGIGLPAHKQAVDQAQAPGDSTRNGR